MNYILHITRAAERDITSAADYIRHVLLNPQAADALLDEAESRLSDLAFFPEKHPLIDDPVLKSWGIRCAAVKNCFAFYKISAHENRVYVLRFLYGKRDWVSILKQGTGFE